jgi:hypothetical protein
MYLEDHIKETKQLFGAWRKNKQSAGERIPEALLERVAALSRSGVPHSDLSRAFGVGYAKIDQVLKLFPRANRNTLERLYRKEDIERIRANRCLPKTQSSPTQEIQHETEAAVQLQQTSSKESDEPSELEAATKLSPTEECPSMTSTPTAIAPAAESEAPNCTVIQVIDADCVQRIREHRALLSGEPKAAPNAKRTALLGEMVSSQGTRLLLFEHVPFDAIQAMIGAFIQADREVAHVASQRC